LKSQGIVIIAKSIDRISKLAQQQNSETAQLFGGIFRPFSRVFSVGAWVCVDLGSGQQISQQQERQGRVRVRVRVRVSVVSQQRI
jgi:hypothetical protein